MVLRRTCGACGSKAIIIKGDTAKCQNDECEFHLVNRSLCLFPRLKELLAKKAA